MEEKNRLLENHPAQNHSSQTFWQIYLPLIISGLIAGTAFYFLLRGDQAGSMELRVWADISAVLTILFLFLFIFFLLAFCLLGSFGLHRVNRFTHESLSRLNRTVSRISGWIVSILGHLQKGMIETEAYASLLSHKPKE